MPLVSATLQSGFLDLFKNNKPKDGADAAKKFAKVYDDYAKQAMIQSTVSIPPIIPPMFTGSEVKTLESMLLPALQEPKAGAPPIIAAAWANGVQAYWFAPPIMGQPGAVGIPPPPPVGFGGLPQVVMVLQAATVVPIILPALTALFTNIMNTEELTASTMASVLDSATKTVTFLVTPPGVPATIL